MILKEPSIACHFVRLATISEALQYTPVFDVVSKNFRVNPVFLWQVSVTSLCHSLLLTASALEAAQ
jgi:hypothetical protein